MCYFANMACYRYIGICMRYVRNVLMMLGIFHISTFTVKTSVPSTYLCH